MQAALYSKWQERPKGLVISNFQILILDKQMIQLVSTKSVYILSYIDNDLIFSMLGNNDEIAQYLDGFATCWVIYYRVYIYNSKRNMLIITQLTSDLELQKDSKIITLPVINHHQALYRSVLDIHADLATKGYTRVVVLANNTIIAEYAIL